MKRRKLLLLLASLIVVLGIVAYWLNNSSLNPNKKYALGQPLDSLNGVVVYYNGMVGHSEGRNTSADGYNIGMKYQCVEFVKRYYYQRFHHKMPDAYGNAKDFFDRSLADSTFNSKRGLLQFSNGGKVQPQPEDLIIFDSHPDNSYGHVAIIATVSDTAISIIQQNPGPFAASRETLQLAHHNNSWTIQKAHTLGWLRKAADTVLKN